MNPFLQKAYTETAYVILNEEQIFEVFVDQFNNNFNKWCNTKKITSWAVITAYNPYSKELLNTENRELNHQLKDTILQQGFRFNEARGVPKNSDWDSEESFFIHNITLQEAKEIGVNYKQNAIITGSYNQNAQLIWLV